MTDAEFHARFPDEEHAYAYLHEVRWPRGFVCPKCGSTGWPRGDNTPGFACKRGHCVTVTSGTAFHRTRVPLRTWLRAVHILNHASGTSVPVLQSLLGIHFPPTYRLRLFVLAARPEEGFEACVANLLAAGPNLPKVPELTPERRREIGQQGADRRWDGAMQASLALDEALRNEEDWTS